MIRVVSQWMARRRYAELGLDMALQPCVRLSGGYEPMLHCASSLTIQEFGIPKHS